MLSLNKHLWLVFLGTICIGFAPLLVRFSDLSPSLIGFYRTGIAGALLLSYHLLCKKKLPKVPGFYIITFIGGFFFAMDLLVWHRSIHIIGPGMATILGNTQVFYLLLIGLILFKERITPVKILTFIGAFLGVLLILKGQLNFFNESDYFYGCLFGLLTGLFYACYTTTLKKSNAIKPSPSAVSIITFTSLSAAIWLLLFSFFETGYKGTFRDNWVYLVGLACICQILGWGLISSGLKKAPLSIAGLIILIQPVIAKIGSIFIFKEPFSLLESIGAGILLICVYFGTKRDRS